MSHLKQSFKNAVQRGFSRFKHTKGVTAVSATGLIGVSGFSGVSAGLAFAPHIGGFPPLLSLIFMGGAFQAGAMVVVPLIAATAVAEVGLNLARKRAPKQQLAA